MRTPSLFDPLPHEIEVVAYAGFTVPQDVFLTWTPRRQFEYCAARDEDSAQQPGNADMREFYLERAAAYRQLCL